MLARYLFRGPRPPRRQSVSASKPDARHPVEGSGSPGPAPFKGMLNRKGLSAPVTELTEQSRLKREPVGVIVGDLDHFKSINDTHARSVGDAVLKNVAHVLHEQRRAFDLVYRIGGERFVSSFPDRISNALPSLPIA